jgi:hypothetical protein
LYVDEDSKFVDWLLGDQTIIDLSAVHTFDASFDSSRVAETKVVEVLKRLGPSLKHLALRRTFLWEWSRPFLSFSCNILFNFVGDCRRTIRGHY